MKRVFKQLAAHLFCIHVSTLFILTIYVKQYEIFVFIINVWGCTEILPLHLTSIELLAREKSQNIIAFYEQLSFVFRSAYFYALSTPRKSEAIDYTKKTKKKTYKAYSCLHRMTATVYFVNRQSDYQYFLFLNYYYFLVDLIFLFLIFIYHLYMQIM